MGRLISHRVIILFWVCLFFLFSLSLAGAQDVSKNLNMVPDELLEDSLYIQLKTTVLNGEQNMTFQALATQLNLPGRAVRLDLRARDGRIVILLTPYPLDEKNCTLVAQTEIWTTADDGSKGFYTTFSSTVVNYGEITTLYPYGGKRGKNGTLQISISIDPYETIAHTVSDPSELYTEKVLFPLSGE